MVQTCPTEEMLKNLLSGSLEEAELTGVSQHLEGCVRCQAKVKTFAQDDTLVVTLRADAQLTNKIVGEMPGKLLDKVKQIARAPHLDNTVDQTVSTGGEGDDNEVHHFPFLSPAQGSDELGRLGQYRILKVLGQGGMGAVFLADDPALERQVALKVMLPKLAENQAAKQRFLREARLAAKLKNDHIVTIFQVGEEQGVPFLAMELLEGMSLDGYLRALKPGKQIGLPQICRVGREIAKGLAVAHEHGMIHRDIKPANLWLDKSNTGRIKILDFGLARGKKDDIHLTQSGAIVGTPAYMAPEQARGDKEVDARADLFSLGCVLYRLCVGEIPFRADTTMGVLLAIATQEPTPPSTRNRAIPAELSSLIMQLLRKDPNTRPASAKEVVTRLLQIEKQLQEGKQPAKPAEEGPTEIHQAASKKAEPEQTVLDAPRRRQRRAEPQPQPRKRRPLVFALVACLLTSLLLLAAGVLYVVTNHGTIEIITDDPTVKILVEEQGGKVTSLDPQSKLIWTLNTGTYTLRLEGAADGLEIELPKEKAFTMKRAGKQVVSIRKLPAPPDTGVKPPVVATAVPGSNYALHFTGEQYVDISKVKLDAKTLQAFTIEAWVTIDHTGKQRQEPKSQAVLVGEEEIGLKCQLIPMGKDGPVGAHLAMLAKHVAGVSTSKVPNDGTPMHVAGVFDGKQVAIFINGKLSTRGNEHLSGIPFTKEPLALMVGRHFKGTLDEIHISKTARYTNDFTPSYRSQPDQETIALYHCDEGKGEILKDSSSNGHDGKLVGAHWLKLPEAPTKPAEFVAALTSPTFEWSTPVNLGNNVNTIRRELSPTLSDDERLIIFDRDQKLWQCQRAHRLQPFGKAEPLPDAFNVKPVTTPSLSGDGLVLVYAVTPAPQTQPEVWLATRAKLSDEFGVPARFTDKADALGSAPVLSQDGLTLLLTSMGRGKGDIKEYTRRARTEPFGEGRYLNGALVSESYEIADWVSNDGLVVIATKMAQKPHETQVYHRPNREAPFTAGPKMTLANNIKELGRAWLSPDAQRCYFHSRDLPDGKGELDLWVSERLAKPGNYAQPDREIAHWLLERQVVLRLEQQGNFLDVRTKEELPADDFAIVTAELQKMDLEALPVVLKLEKLTGIMVPEKNANAWLEALTKLNRLTMVNAYASDLTDQGLAQLARCSNLDYLNLHACSKITGAGLAHLVKHKALRVLNVDGELLQAGKFTLDDLRKLKQASARLTITKDESMPIPELANNEVNPDKYVNELGMEFVRVPKGEGWLGGGPGKAGKTPTVFKDDFYLGTYEVTQEEWVKLLGTNPSRFARTGSFKDRVANIGDEDLKRHPVEAVSWNDTQLLLQRLNEKVKEAGWFYRLPTSDEWEYACRCGPANKPMDHAFACYFAQPNHSAQKEHANYKATGLNRPWKVSAGTPNKLGLYNMHGNVAELCQNTQRDKNATLSIVRGGTCLDDPGSLHASTVSLIDVSAQFDGVGLRLARVRIQTDK